MLQFFPRATAIAVFSLSVPALGGAADEADIMIAAHMTPANPRMGGLVNGGVAVLEGSSGILANPALPNTYHAAGQNKLSCALSYGRGTVFSRNILMASAAYSLSPQVTVGGMYRLLHESKEREQNDFVLNASGRMFDNSVDRGAVDIGLSARYESMDWRINGLPTPYTYKKSPADSLWVPADTGELPRYPVHQERRLLFDVGFYQRNFTETLDFGLTLHNIVGYLWRRHRPEIVTTQTVSVDTTGSAPDTAWYKESYRDDDTTRWLPAYYKRLSFGMLYHMRIVDNRALLQIPAQIDMLGLFDRGADTHFMIRTGLEVWVKDSYCLRFGYARAPRFVPWVDVKGHRKAFGNENIFGGGGSLRIQQFSFDLYIYGDEWGLGASIAF